VGVWSGCLCYFFVIWPMVCLSTTNSIKACVGVNLFIRELVQGHVNFSQEVKEWGVVSGLPNPQAGGLLLYACMLLFTQYIHSTLLIGGCASICNLRTHRAVVPEEWGHVKYSQWVWYFYENSMANRVACKWNL
jgi:hypothetical protein